ncbi:MAG: hypothetical protein WA941_19170 [Nitrososphaeraceae archaeon]
MMGSLTFDISMHDILNPPYGNRGSNIKLRFENSKNAISIFPGIHNNKESIFSFLVSNPLTSGLKDSEEATVQHFVDDLILSFNLVLRRGCITRNKTRQHSIKFDHQGSGKSTSYVVKADGMTNVYLFDSISIRDKVNAVVTTHDEIDEIEVSEIFEKVIHFRRHEDKNDFRETNLSLCLRNYEKAMEMKTSFKYKSLLNSLEFIVNVSGIDLTGDRLDREVYRLSGIPVLEARNWRQFYDRLKHVQRSNEDIRKLIEGNRQFTRWMLSLRECTKQLIKSQLI